MEAARAGTRSVYAKVLDREAWTHAVITAAVVLQMDGPILRGCAEASRRFRGGSPRSNERSPASRLRKPAKAGEIAIAGARPLAKNGPSSR